MTSASLLPFRDPASVAIVGASDDPTKWGYWLAAGALRGAHRRRVHLVNHSAKTIHGVPVSPSLSAIPEAPELVVLCMPPRYAHDVVSEALANGTRAFLGITAGITDQPTIREMIRGAGARIIGPNSLGIYDAESELHLAWGHFLPGDLAIVTQSGQLGSEIANLGARAGLGVSRFVSVGNQLDVTATEIIEDLRGHEATRMVALYLESFADGERLVGTLRTLADAGKPTIVLTTGASDGSQRLAESHTGSLTSALDTVDAACRAAGVIRVSTPAELVDLARFLGVSVRPAGRRVAVVSDSGGQGGIAADVASVNGLDLPLLSSGLQQKLEGLLPAGAAVANPIDLAGAGEADLNVYAELVEHLLASGEVDAVLVTGYLGCYGEGTPIIEQVELGIVDRIGAAARESGRPVAIHTMSAGSAAVERMWTCGIAAYGGIESAVRALASAAGLAANPGRTLEVSARAATVPPHGYWAARTFLADHGIPVPEGLRATDREEIGQAARSLRYPVVLKAGWLEHKSEHGGVRLGIGSAEELIDAYDEMHLRLGDGDYVVEEQDTRPDAVEILVGARRDRDFGPLVVVGAGGTETELHRDVRVELAPVDRATAVAMIAELQCYPLLQGWRGRPATDVDSLAAIIVSISEAVAANPHISELDVNPVRVAPGGALAVDALILS